MGKLAVVLNHPILLAIALLLVAAFCWGFWAIWRDRRVDFICQIHFPSQGEDAAVQMFDRLVPMLIKYGYQSSAAGGNTSGFERRFIPGWAFIVAIFFFPIGLLALFARNRDTLTIVSTDTALDLHGHCNKHLADYIIAVGQEVEAESETAVPHGLT